MAAMATVSLPAAVATNARAFTGEAGALGRTGTKGRRPGQRVAGRALDGRQSVASSRKRIASISWRAFGETASWER